MAERIKQVLVTYVTHRYIVAATLFTLLILVAPNIIAMSGHHDRPEEIAASVMFALGMPLLFVARFLVGHVKTQFAHWRARLTPHFVQSHVAVLAACLVLMLIVYPMLLASWAHAQPAGFLAIAMAIAAPSIWSAHRGRGVGLIVALIVFYSLFTEWGAHWWILDSAEHWYIHAAIVSGGVVSLGVWLRRLCDLREEMPDYQNNMNWRVGRPGGGEVVEQRRATAAQICRSPLITRISDVWLARLPVLDDRRGRPTFTKLLTYGFSSWPAEMSSLFVGLMMAVVTLFMADFAIVARNGTANMLNIFIFFATFMPAFSGGESLAHRRPRIATELLRPLTREQLVGGLFTAAARNTANGWLIQNTLLAIVAWHIVGSQLTPGSIIFYAILSAAAAFAMLGLSLRISVCQSQFKRLVAVMAPWSAAAAIGAALAARSAAISRGAAVTQWNFDNWPVLLVAALAFTAVGAALVASARRAWLNLELG